MVTKFGEPGGVGEMLQKQLEQRAVEKDNWVSDYWYPGFHLARGEGDPLIFPELM